MGKDRTGLRRRGEIVTTAEIDSKSGEANEERAEIKLDTMRYRIFKIFSSYRILILFSAVVCILQILVGVSFFHTVSHLTNSKSEVKTHQFEHLNKEAKVLDSRILPSDLSLSCNVTGKEAISAINRAKTHQCRQEIVDLVCALDKGDVYPTSLKRTCPSSVNKEKQGKHTGCFKDSFSTRILQGYLVKLKTQNSPTLCVGVCTKAGFSYAGVQYGVECFCGNSSPKTDLALDQKKCNTPCPGDPNQSCGGYLVMDVYETGLQPLAPPKLGSEKSETENPPVKIVYLLTVAGRASKQVYRLIRQIYSPDHYIFIHVDSRQEFMYRELQKLTTILPNLRMVKKRFSTIWGGASLLKMLLSAIKELVEMKDWTDWDFVLNLSESDYPVKTQNELVTFLSNNRDNNFVKGHGREPDKFIKKQGLDKTFYECDTHMWRLGSRTLPLGVQIDGGSDWICLNKKFAMHVIQSQDELLVGLKKVFSHTLLPAESFFHTVLRNSEFCQTYIDNNLHLTNWKRKIGCKCQYKAVVDWCGCSPNDFLPEDWAKLEGTRPRQLFFARKFEPIIHLGIINRVEEWSKNITLEESHSKHSYWQNVFHSEDSKGAVDVQSLEHLVKDEIDKLSTLKETVFQLQNIETIHTYSYKDELKGFLINYNAINFHTGAPSVKSELFIEHRPKLIMVAKAQTRLKHMAVGTEFDPKEQIFRNYLSLLNQDSKLALRISFSEGQTEILRFGWFDPHFNLVATSKTQLNDTSGKDSVNPVLSHPLLPGVWSVICVSNGHLVAKEQFLVNPIGGREIHSASSTIIHTDSSLEKFIQQDKLSGKDNVIDSDSRAAEFVKQFYIVVDKCSKDDIQDNLNKCSETEWSSFYPDPKSQIFGVDPQSGKLL